MEPRETRFAKPLNTKLKFQVSVRESKQKKNEIILNASLKQWYSIHPWFIPPCALRARTFCDHSSWSFLLVFFCLKTLSLNTQLSPESSSIFMAKIKAKTFSAREKTTKDINKNNARCHKFARQWLTNKTSLVLGQWRALWLLKKRYPHKEKKLWIRNEANLMHKHFCFFLRESAVSIEHDRKLYHRPKLKPVFSRIAF